MKSENASLHVQLENLSTQLSALRQMATENEEGAGGGGNTSKLDSSLLSKSFHEDDAKSTDQLMEIVKYLRKEKALSEQKVEVVQVRNQTLELQHCWHLATLYSAATSEDLAISLFKTSLRVVFFRDPQMLLLRGKIVAWLWKSPIKNRSKFILNDMVEFSANLAAKTRFTCT